GGRGTSADVARAGLVLTLLASLGCGEPLEPPPSVYDMPALAGQLDADDGIADAGELRLSGFVNGEPIYYWTFGVGGERAMPLYRLCRVEGDEECAPIDHPPIVDALPGDEGYAP